MKKDTTFFLKNSPFEKTTENWLKDKGATSLSDGLKTNTTLTKLDLGCDHKMM